MANKLTAAIAKGTATTVKGAVKAAGRRAIRGLKPPSLYNLGLGIGPTLANITKEYKKSNKQAREDGSPQRGDDSSSFKNVAAATNIRNELSSIASILSDIRKISYAQLQMSRNPKHRGTIIDPRARFTREEELLESKPGLSSLTEDARKNNISAGGGLVEFFKNNPMMSVGLIGGAALIIPELRQAILGNGNKERIKKLADGIVGTVGSAIGSLLDEVLGLRKDKLDENGKPTGEKEGFFGNNGKAVGYGALGAYITKKLFKRSLPGLVAGAYFGTSDDPSMEGTLGAAAAGLALPWAMGKAGGALWGAAKDRLGFGKTPVMPTTPPTGTGSPSGRQPVQRAPGRPPIYRTPGAGLPPNPIGQGAKQGVFKKSIKLIVKLTARMSARTLAAMIATRVAIGAGVGAAVGAVGGPVALITALIGAGLTLFTIYDMLVDIEKELDSTDGDRVGVEPTSPASGIKPSPTSYSPGGASQSTPATGAPVSGSQSAPTDQPSQGKYDSPIPGATRLSSVMGEDRGTHKHGGVDIPMPEGTDVQAIGEGEVAKVKYSSTYGKMIEVVHPDGTRSVYAHLSETIAKVKQKVKKGQVIGKVGSTGRSTGPHLHLEIKSAQGKQLDPTGLIPQLATLKGGGTTVASNGQGSVQGAPGSGSSSAATSSIGFDVTKIGGTTQQMEKLNAAYSKIVDSKEMRGLQNALAKQLTQQAPAQAPSKQSAPSEGSKTTAAPQNRYSPNKERLNLMTLVDPLGLFTRG